MNLSVFVSDPGLAAVIGKRGTESDISLFNYKDGDKHLNIITPSRYPEKLSSLIFSIQMADAAVLTISEINRELGEIIVALDSSEIKKGFIILKNYLLPEQVAPILKGTVLEGYEIIEDEPAQVRNLLFSAVETISRADMSEHPLYLTVDHSFPVKGIGTVVLGIVNSGTVRKHQKLKLNPGGREVIVKSIQVHDVDVDAAGPGSRVGLALKNIKADEVSRGSILSTEELHVVEEDTDIEVVVNPFFKKSVEAGDVIHAFAGLQSVPVRVLSGRTEAGQRSVLSIRPEKEFAVYPGIPLMLTHLDSRPLRVIGRFFVPEGE